MIPALIAGAVVGYAIGKSSDEKKETWVAVDESEVPEWVKKEIEKKSTDNKNNPKD